MVTLRDRTNNLQPDHLQPNNLQPDHLQPNNLQPDHLQPDHLQPDHLQLNNLQPDHLQPHNFQPTNQKKIAAEILSTARNFRLCTQFSHLSVRVAWPKANPYAIRPEPLARGETPP
ncbi:MAG: hypothetical protein F6K26_52625 [Moorea sp. SIO2I5]|nr:hypothetical protein [Moorena sp. SIO2I5]